MCELNGFDKSDIYKLVNILEDNKIDDFEKQKIIDNNILFQNMLKYI